MLDGNAWFLPSLSTQFVKSLNDEISDQRDRHHLKLNSIDELNFLNEEAIFHYPVALYSPGHTDLDITKSRKLERIIFEKDKKCIIIADSGGYQVITGKLKGLFDNNGNFNDDLRLKLLRWMEAASDVMMTLDIPLFSLLEENLAEYKKRNKYDAPYKNFDDCLKLTIDSLEFYEQHKSGEVPFINIIHGEDVQQAQKWYEEVKFFEADGWAFGGALGGDLYLTLNQLIYMRDQGALNEAKWLHFLGFGTGYAAIMFNSLQKNLKKISPQIQVTYDASNPFQTASFRNISVLVKRSNRKSPYVCHNDQFNSTSIDQPSQSYPFSTSPVLQEIPWGDIVVNPECKNFGKGSYNMDGLSYVILHANNVYQSIDVIEKSLVAFDSGEVSDQIILDCAIIDEIFESKTPYITIEKYQGKLRGLHG